MGVERGQVLLQLVKGFEASSSSVNRLADIWITCPYSIK
jgi:hypothetical protein